MFQERQHQRPTWAQILVLLARRTKARARPPVFEPPLNMIEFVPGAPSDPATAGYIVPGVVGGTPLAQLDPKEISRMNATQLSDLTNAAETDSGLCVYSIFADSSL